MKNQIRTHSNSIPVKTSLATHASGTSSPPSMYHLQFQNSHQGRHTSQCFHHLRSSLSFCVGDMQAGYKLENRLREECKSSNQKAHIHNTSSSPNECLLLVPGRLGNLEDCEVFVETKINFVSRCILPNKAAFASSSCSNLDCSLT